MSLYFNGFMVKNSPTAWVLGTTDRQRKEVSVKQQWLKELLTNKLLRRTSNSLSQGRGVGFKNGVGKNPCEVMSQQVISPNI